MKLYEIFQLLDENRLPKIKQALGDKLQAKIESDPSVTIKTSDEFVDKVSSADPSGNKQYTQWLLMNYLKGNTKAEDLYKSKDDLAVFDKYKKSLPEKDINKYTPDTLYSAVKDINPEEPQSKRQEKQKIKVEGADVVLKGPDATILRLKTEEAACYYGKGTKWCTAATSSDNMFDYYNNRGDVYVAMCNDGRKFQFHYDRGENAEIDDNDNYGEYQFMDEQDDEIHAPAVAKKYPTIGRFFDKVYKPAALKSPYAASYYARNILGGRVPEAEPIIATNPTSAKQYARDVIRGRWPEAEPIIATDPTSAYQYARDVIRGRWPEAEPEIATDPGAAYQYAADILKDGWPEAEPIIATDPTAAYQYARDIIEERWPEAEPEIATRSHSAYQYARDVIRGRWPEAEPIIATNPNIAKQYARDVIRGPWPEAGIN